MFLINHPFFGKTKNHSMNITLRKVYQFIRSYFNLSKSYED